VAGDARNADLYRWHANRYNAAMRNPSVPGNARAYVGEFRNRVAMQTRQVHDPFGINPIRRSLLGASVSLSTIVLPFYISESVGSVVMLAVGWLAMAVLVFSLPILVWSLSERAYRAIYHRIHPPVDDLDISARVVNILHRHGVHTIRDVSRRDDPELLLMSNMDPRDVDALRRAVNLWRYRRWQEAGFPASGAD